MVMSTRGFRARRRCVHQIFTVKQIGEKAREKKRRVEEKTDANWEALTSSKGKTDYGAQNK